ncbi:DUF6270 domain-containing protein [Corynebacterium aquilae]|uniref:Uncharacterized protein n=1 Tax=Corynebacterium aquilae DSM 44791 TaxID=1431546 RepID=A0A1L7CIH7_9CORY|nr:DUF6270 domain-containing protein [Corynebacterium aquilae]APT85660.1 hypothetical protein CAQU_12125 [Corynebacterium aquilae DSM 44791]
MNQLFIYGSCVSRDTLEFMRDRNQNWSLEYYVARQSLISAQTTIPFEALGIEPPKSKFQFLKLWEDCVGRGFRSMREHYGKADLFLWDLCDERLGVFEFADGNFATRTVEYLAATSAQSVPEGARLIEFGTDEHFSLWKNKLELMKENLQYANFTRRALLKIPWALTTRDHRETPSSFGLLPEAANHLYDRYYQAVIETIDIDVVEPKGVRVFADANHKWGLAPFHYEASVYEYVASQLERIVSR